MFVYLNVLILTTVFLIFKIATFNIHQISIIPIHDMPGPLWIWFSIIADCVIATVLLFKFFFILPESVSQRDENQYHDRTRISITTGRESLSPRKQEHHPARNDSRPAATATIESTSRHSAVRYATPRLTMHASCGTSCSSKVSPGWTGRLAVRIWTL